MLPFCYEPSVINILKYSFVLKILTWFQKVFSMQQQFLSACYVSGLDVLLPSNSLTGIHRSGCSALLGQRGRRGTDLFLLFLV